MGAVYSLAGDTADVGMDAQTPVTDDYDLWDNAFTGTIHTVKVAAQELSGERHSLSASDGEREKL